jgi:hypothetical protein
MVTQLPQRVEGRDVQVGILQRTLRGREYPIRLTMNIGERRARVQNERTIRRMEKVATSQEATE